MIYKDYLDTVMGAKLKNQDEGKRYRVDEYGFKLVTAEYF
jgi:hypothetical protein